MGLITSIKSGENSGRLLENDFVVLNHQRHHLTAEKGLASAMLDAPEIPKLGQARNALVVWISKGGSPAVIQAVASYF